VNEHQAGDPAWRDDDDLDALLLAAKMMGLEALRDSLPMDAALSPPTSESNRQLPVPGSAGLAEDMRRSRPSRSPPGAVD
jgi:hypothetical protein